jgi:hypothetical protein
MKRHPEEQLLYALFESPAEVEGAMKRLVDAGISIDDISLMLDESTPSPEFAGLERTRTAKGVAAGTLIGGSLGGVVGGLVGLGATMTGIGLIVVGPLLVMAAAGGIMGGLIGHGLPAEEAERLHNAVKAGQAMIAVHTHEPDEVALVRGIFAELHGDEVEVPRPTSAAFV